MLWNDIFGVKWLDYESENQTHNFIFTEEYYPLVQVDFIWKQAYVVGYV